MTLTQKPFKDLTDDRKLLEKGLYHLHRAVEIFHKLEGKNEKTNTSTTVTNKPSNS